MMNAQHNQRAEQSTDHPKEKMAGEGINDPVTEGAEGPAGNKIGNELPGRFCGMRKTAQ